MPHATRGRFERASTRHDRGLLTDVNRVGDAEERLDGAAVAATGLDLVQIATEGRVGWQDVQVRERRRTCFPRGASRLSRLRPGTVNSSPTVLPRLMSRVVRSRTSCQRVVPRPDSIASATAHDDRPVVPKPVPVAPEDSLDAGGVECLHSGCRFPHSIWRRFGRSPLLLPVPPIRSGAGLEFRHLHLFVWRETERTKVSPA